MPKSARKILLALSSSSYLKQKEIQRLTGLSIRSVKGSLIFLKERKLVQELVVLEDMRCRVYRVGGGNDER
ncbi:MAG: hypothetical protein CO092_05515 [Candidatus Aenigmarchaeota archaeon CG_4_9_14_3_um_filter_37_18]|nr:MAG: hypothetical protein AUJ50_05060 [Candidatus Aenigmarchaeota archaeon CG1_02_38_14]PIV68094.1 MAG: hypothetical protein COS07_05310 [Candidatus Aenigmarchaeota archaeon CG01_land_8_20_14_3_00_37_9]PIX50316.1 MAG: hypothetical protein COZ52_04820 [Candidatus Aenigmarchaeota archaeon CG_4_8_14_3_um_filter_37_24]PIY35070.1 MAG: hypothetical protein COZ04_04790 [Candidatus Aenigmarchaeota archaeon CG_4_10_14_3_um_filter_37_21]PJB73984.1 MAG: hypothetical protein CO092_05515 [Candidatus Aeni